MKFYDREKDSIEIVDIEKCLLEELQRKVEEAEDNLRNFKKEIFEKYTRKEFGILTYLTLERKHRLSCDMRKVVHTILANRTWEIIDNGKIYPRYYHVFDKHHQGNHINTISLVDLEFVPLDNVTFEDAKKILKEVKKNKPND